MEHRGGGLAIRNRTLFGDYDRGYQNYVPGRSSPGRGPRRPHAPTTTRRPREPVQPDRPHVRARDRPHPAHRCSRARRSDASSPTTSATPATSTAPPTSISVPLTSPTIETPVTFRQNATDADNHLRTNVAAAYAQDQVELSPRSRCWPACASTVSTSSTTTTATATCSPAWTTSSLRAPASSSSRRAVSVYGSYSVSYLPSSGRPVLVAHHRHAAGRAGEVPQLRDRARSGTRPDLSLTTAVYRLDRTNTRSTDPNDPTRIVQTGSQRTNGFEIGLSGRVTRAWSVAGGYAYQDAFVTSATAAARAGAQVAQVPHHTFSLWNHVQVLPRSASGSGRPPHGHVRGHRRHGGAARLRARRRRRLLHAARTSASRSTSRTSSTRRTYANADSNTNISPGFRRALRVGVDRRLLATPDPQRRSRDSRSQRPGSRPPRTSSAGTRAACRRATPPCGRRRRAAGTPAGRCCRTPLRARPCASAKPAGSG